MESSPPLILLSSGRSPRYRDDIVRALALPAGGRLQFRYRLEIVAKQVVDAVRERQLAGRTCYLAYVDVSAPGKKPDVIPVREATVLDAFIRGGSLIIRMKVERYILADVLESVQKHVEDSVVGALPSWKPDYAQHPNDALTGYWVNFLSRSLSNDQLVAHSTGGDNKHLEYFEASVRHLCKHDDFTGKEAKLFFNVIGLRDSGSEYVALKDGRWILSARREYLLDVYHYSPSDPAGASAPVSWIGCRAMGDAVKTLGSEFLRADSAYDTKTVILLTTGSVRRSQNALAVFRTTDREDDGAHTAEVVFPVEVAVDIGWNAFQAFLVGAPIATAGLLALNWDQAGWAWRAPLIVVSGLLAGFVAVFKKS